MPREESTSPGGSGDEAVPMTHTASTDSKGRPETSLKRGRAESVEPLHSEVPSLPTTASKKNRLAPSTGQTPSKPLDPAETPNLDAKATANATVVDPKSIAEETEEEERETGNVGEVRRKVEEMTHDEKLEKAANKAKEQGEEEGVEVELPEKDGEQPDSAMSISTRAASPKPEVPDSAADAPASDLKDEGKEGLKRKALNRSQSSYAPDEVENKRAKDELDQTEKKDDKDSQAKSEPAVAAPAAKKPQATFSSFSSTSSPFGAKASPFAVSGNSSPFGAVASEASSSAATPSAFSRSGFGNYSSSFSPFAKATPAAKASDKEGAEKKTESSSTSFGDILSANVGDDNDEGENKVKMTEQDVHTGEEEEDTAYQTRTKLYVMESDGGWRERGVGTLKINVRRSDQKGARLVMRAEGVLRLILNVSLYVGMSVLEDGKYVRVTVFEDGEKRFITFRTGSNKVAGELYHAITEHIPAGDSASQKETKDEAGKSPSKEDKV